MTTPELSKAEDSAREFRMLLSIADGRAMTSLVQSYAPIYEELQDNLTDLVDLAKTRNLKPWEVNRHRRMEELLTQFDKNVSGFASIAQNRITEAELEAVGLVNRSVKEMAEAAVPDGMSLDNMARVGVRWNQFPDDEIANIVAISGSGGPLATIIQDGVPLDRQQLNIMRKKMVSGIALGYNSKVVGKRIAAEAGLPLSKSMRIARTEIARSAREATRANYDLNRHIVPQYRRMCAQSENTCAACFALDGMIYESSQMMETHPNCRCVMVPVTVTYKELGIDAPDPKAPPSAKDWLRKQPDEVQQKVLGSERLEALRSGRLRWDDMVTHSFSDQWGSTVGVQSLKNLASRNLLENSARFVAQEVITQQAVKVATQARAVEVGKVYHVEIDAGDVKVWNRSVEAFENRKDSLFMDREMRHYGTRTQPDKAWVTRNAGTSDPKKIEALYQRQVRAIEMADEWLEAARPIHTTKLDSFKLMLTQGGIDPVVKQKVKKRKKVGLSGGNKWAITNEAEDFGDGIAISLQATEEGVRIGEDYDVHIRLKKSVMDRTIMYKGDVIHYPRSRYNETSRPAGIPGYATDALRDAYRRQALEEAVGEHGIPNRFWSNQTFGTSSVGYRDAVSNTNDANSFSRVRQYSFNEGRTLGGATLDDIQEVVIHKNWQNSKADVAEVEKLAKEMGVKVKIVERSADPKDMTLFLDGHFKD